MQNKLSYILRIICLTIIYQLGASRISYAAVAPNDPFEAYNRRAFYVNRQVDKFVIRPTTIWYITNVPDPVQGGTSNFFGNLRDFVTLGNDILQLEAKQSMATFMRVSLNSVFGILGLFDVASSLGLVGNKNTFGSTLRFYGWKNSSYLILPLMGPSTVRDALGTAPDIYFNPVWYVLNNNYISVGLFVIGAIDARAKFLGADQFLNTSLDPYITMRDFYLQSNGDVPINQSATDFSIDDVLNDK